MEPSRAIIDTDLLIDHLRNKRATVDFISKLEEKKYLLATTSVNAFELYYGSHKSSSPKKSLQATRKLLSRLVILPLTLRSAQEASYVYAELEQKGQTIGLRDTLIGAIALIKDFPIATNNKIHFQKISNLKIISHSDI